MTGRSGPLGLLQDARARVTRALEAIIDGELLLAEQILEDLLTDLARALDREKVR
jgi:hypothetical protein